MRRRLYFLLPDVASARAAANDLLLARIEDRHMHFLARRGTDLGGLHEANYLQKSDMGHGAAVGFLAGGALGILLGAFLVSSPIDGTQPHLGWVVAAALVGALIGIWTGSMAGSSVPNSRLRAFQDEISRGAVLAIVDVPFARVGEIQDLMQRGHPELRSSTVETRYPVFP